MKRFCMILNRMAAGCPGSLKKSVSSCRGLALMEIILILVIIGIIGARIISFQASSWKRTGTSNRMLVAGQMIERQVEKMRMHVDSDPDNNFPPGDSTFSENGITLECTVSPVYRFTDPSKALDHVRKCELTASWGSGKDDSLNVTAYLSKNF